MHSKRLLIPLVLAATFYGCGGGSDNGDNPPARPELSSIDEATAPKSVATAYVAGTTLFEGSTSAAAVVGMTSKSAAERSPGLVEFSIDRLRALRAPRASSAGNKGSISTKAPIDEQESCVNGGTARIVGDIADQTDFLLSTGDHATITFSHCEIDGVTIDGQLILSEIVVAENTSSRFEFRKVQLGYQGDRSNIDGSFHLSIPTDYDESKPIPVALRDVSLQASSNGRTVTLSNVASDTTIDFNSGSFSYSMAGGVADSASGVSVTLTTTTLEGDYFADTLNAGEMTVEGAKSSRARAKVSAPNELVIEVDADGDGNFEKTLDPIAVSELLGN